MSLDTVYVVEEHTASGKSGYWSHAYLSLAKATADAEYWARKGERGSVRWETGSFGVQIGHLGESGDRFTIVPLAVKQDNDPPE